MVMSENEKQKIIEYAIFLEQKGYLRTIGDNTIVYSSVEIEFIITFEPHSDVSDVSIKFVKENEVYSIGWIACVRGGMNINPRQRLENVIILLSYVRENYSTIIDSAYCKESNKLIDEFIAKEKKRIQ